MYIYIYIYICACKQLYCVCIYIYIYIVMKLHIYEYYIYKGTLRVKCQGVPFSPSCQIHYCGSGPTSVDQKFTGLEQTHEHISSIRSVFMISNRKIPN